ncbi:MAG: hypothetical protein BAA01_07735 [Bacillus thermozeamaize]|jgi:uncharacterized alkaline shock family protein YloU|uniref:Alkaline-shock protein n=1 Tax=Bacillus thermozeamaize TaxID=230954 RepID=A0A1Y3PBU9_9BACI|nr:MAG: hypothetical protein BAA01_07735 [Bacillus thermozeamaize]
MEAYVPDYVKSELGSIEIDSNVVRIIAALACLEVPGVVAMSGGGGWMEDIADWFSKNLSKGVTVTMDQSNVSIDLRVVAEYGKPLNQIGRNIQDNVRYTVESMTGLHVDAVNVFIVDVDFVSGAETK